MALTLTRASTIYSLTQLAENGDSSMLPASVCGDTGKRPVADLPGCKLALFTFPAGGAFYTKRIRSFGDMQSAAVPDVDDPRPSSDDEGLDMSSDSSSASAQVVPQRSVMESILFGEWEDRAEQGLFRYDVTACPTRMLAGASGFVAQLNEGRASKKRPTEFRIDQVDQPFDVNKFHFGKALQEEVLFQFKPSPHARSPSFVPSAPCTASPDLVFINVSPIEYGHVLLVPRVLDHLQQLVSPDAMMLALQFAQQADNPYLRVGFNSLGAYATINHLHFQAYFLAAPMAIERAATVPRSCPVAPFGHSRKRGVQVCELDGYAVRGLVFEVGDSLADMARMVGRACQRLTAANVPHNMLIADRGARVFLLPNAFAGRKARGEIPADIVESMVDPGAFEMCGHILLKRQEDYDTSDQHWAWRLLSYASYCEAEFQKVAALALGECKMRS